MEANEMRLEAQDLNQQGAMLLRTGNTEAARAKFDKAIELDPMLMDSYKNYGNLYANKLLPCSDQKFLCYPHNGKGNILLFPR